MERDDVKVTDQVIQGLEGHGEGFRIDSSTVGNH